MHNKTAEKDHAEYLVQQIARENIEHLHHHYQIHGDVNNYPYPFAQWFFHSAPLSQQKSSSPDIITEQMNFVNYLS